MIDDYKNIISSKFFVRNIMEWEIYIIGTMLQEIKYMVYSQNRTYVFITCTMKLFHDIDSV